MKKIRAILLDPFERTIKEVEHNGDFRQIYEFLSRGAPHVPVTDFNAVQVGPRDHLYVDGEGLIKEEPPTHFILWEGYDQPLAGKGLILGVDEEGDTVSARMDLDTVMERVRFTSKIEYLGMVEESGVMDHPTLGEGVGYIRMTPVFKKND